MEKIRWRRGPNRMDQKPIRFTTHRPHGDRRHDVTEDDIRVVLDRIADEGKRRLRGFRLALAEVVADAPRVRGMDTQTLAAIGR